MLIQEYDGRTNFARQVAEPLTYIIKESDIDKTQVQCLLGVHLFPVPFYQFMGKVQAHDVGKLARFNGNIWQVENDEQRDKRLGK